MAEEAWHRNLPVDMRKALNVEKETLGDFSESVERLEVLARFATRRALEGMGATEFSEGEIVEMGDVVEPPAAAKVIEEKELSLRFDVAIRANKEVIHAKMIRLDAQKKHKAKASDTPERANITFDVRHTSPERKLEALKKLGRHTEAKELARAHNLEYEEA
jgi:hypothetical protein